MNDLDAVIKATIKELEELEFNADEEWAHERADTLLCDLLKFLGYTGVVEAWRRVPRWYA